MTGYSSRRGGIPRHRPFGEHGMATESKASWSWNEADSQNFIDHGRYFVPEREEQIETLCSLVPATAGSAHFAELCCGEGLLSEALLDRFPTATVHGYDGSPAMLET